MRGPVLVADTRRWLRLRLAYAWAAACNAVFRANARLTKGAGSPRVLIGHLGIIRTCITIFAPPIIYAVLGVIQLQQRAIEQANLGARHVEVQLTQQQSIDWFNQVSINVLHATRGPNSIVVASWLTNKSGATLTFQGDRSSWPEFKADQPIRASGFEGNFHVAVTTRGVFIGTLYVAAAFFVLGLAAYYAFRRLPLAALDEAQRLLHVKQAELLTQKEQLETQNLRFDAALNNLRDTVVANRPATKIREFSDGRVIATKHQPMPGGGWLATHEDITEYRRIEARITHLAHHDVLTELPNRLLLRERLEPALEAVQKGKSLAVLCLDLDRFKDVNDTLGHAAGDELLKAVSARLRGCVDDADTVARLGGDEFSILQTGRDQPVAATGLAAQITECLAEPFEVDGQQVTVGMSIGIAVSPGDGINPDQLIKNATLALHRAKSEGRGNHRFFEPDMDAYMQARSKLQLDLRKALAKGEFELHYQPIVNLERDEISCLEALMRWHHPERGLVSPGEFIPLAEETGLIVPIGEWALREACAAAAKWPDEIKVAINLSASQFKSRNLVETVFSALAASRLPAPRLEFEITESVLLQNNDATLATLHQLRALGVRIAMDDFGTGYSSLSYLRSFPFDKIKIDRCFVADLSGASEDALAILRAVAGLGRSLGIATTAEGVETKEQLERVREEGCTEMQGYFFSRPRPIREIERLFLTRAEKMAVAG